LHDDVKAFIGDAEQYDDITLLIVRWSVEDDKQRFNVR
jgi:serine phosphatase RsbU (regulator of sigma subunit)